MRETQGEISYGIESRKFLTWIISHLHRSRCTKTMNHINDDISHSTDHRCKYQHQYDNKIFNCKVWSEIQETFDLESINWLNPSHLRTCRYWIFADMPIADICPLPICRYCRYFHAEISCKMLSKSDSLMFTMFDTCLRQLRGVFAKHLTPLFC